MALNITLFSTMTLSISKLIIIGKLWNQHNIDVCYSKCYFFTVTLSVVMLTVIILTVIILNVLILSVILCVIMLGAVASSVTKTLTTFGQPVLSDKTTRINLFVVMKAQP
jgi:hypothetical protein